MKNNKKWVVFAGTGILVCILFFGNLLYGTVHIPANTIIDILCGRQVEREAWTNIVLQSRLPQAITALLAGSGLAVSGLMLQTLFRNPLAGPSILGISDGANLGVAIVILFLGGNIGSGTSLSLGGSLSIMAGALAGATLILLFIIYISTKVRSNIMVLIIGMMTGYLASSGISLLNYSSRAESIRSFVMWGMGNFSGVSLSRIPLYMSAVLAGLLLSILLIKPLNTLLLGERYASNLGVHITRTRVLILICTGILTAAITAFCGPISFIGLAVPHIARLTLGTSNHRTLVPATILSGAAVALICNLMTIIPSGGGLLPLNAVTPLLGAPVIIYIILNRKHYMSL